MRDTIDATVGVVDDTATIIACSDLTKVGTTNEFVSLDLSDVHDIFIRDGYTYKPFVPKLSMRSLQRVISGRHCCEVCQYSGNFLFNIKQYEDEKYDRNNFIKNVVTDNVPPGTSSLRHVNCTSTRKSRVVRR